jgi:predicted ATPase/class 3 adenylate cyclase
VASALPRGVVTFVFTDIEGSTHLLQKLGDRYPSVLDDHYCLLRDAFAAGGREVGPRGDALFVAFADAAEAIAAVVDAQVRLTQHPWPADGPVKVRIGVHTGEAVVQDDDYVGLAVHQAARICAAGHGGQVLASEETLGAATGRLPKDIEVTDLGAHRLKDLPEPLRLYQLSTADLPSSFPGLRHDAAPGNLPKQITSFIGRKREKQEVVGALESGARLVTLTGPGGCGKTRLAIEVAADVVHRHPQGAWVVDLASVREADLVPRTVASALDVGEEPGRSLTTTLLDRLAGRQVLLILDNCEHLVGACAELADLLLRSIGTITILATSQEALDVAGERVVRVPPLPDNDAVDLFVDRAALKRGDFALDDANADVVAQICRRLDGIPLAIELAAARITVLSPQQIAERLDDQFRLLTGGSRNALPRQQTLRAAVDWSHSLLASEEQLLLRRLAVFAGGWTIDAAVVVADIDVLDALERLVARSLVVAEEQDGVARYRLLESIRQYAQEKLAQSGEVEACRDRHLEWFHTVALRAEIELTGPDQAVWLDRLAREHDNMRAAMEWCAAQSDDPARAADLLSLAGLLWRFWLVRGYWGEGRAWLDRALAATVGTHTALRARALAAAGHLATEEGDVEAAAPLLDESLALWRELNDPNGIAEVLNHQGNLARARFEYDTARALLSESLDLRRQAHNERGIAVSLRNLGMLAALQRDHDTARALYEEAVPIARRLGEKRVLSTLTHALSIVAFEDGDRTRARELASEGLTLARELGDKQSIAEHLTVISGINSADGDAAAATSTLDEALTLLRGLGARDALAWAHTTLGDLAISAGDVANAVAHLTKALSEWRRLGDAAAVARVLNLAGWAALMAGDIVQAATWLDDAVTRARVSNDATQLALSLHSLGEQRRLAGDLDVASELLHESIAVANESGRWPCAPSWVAGPARPTASRSRRSSTKLSATAMPRPARWPPRSPCGPRSACLARPSTPATDSSANAPLFPQRARITPSFCRTTWVHPRTTSFPLGGSPHGPRRSAPHPGTAVRWGRPVRRRPQVAADHRSCAARRELLHRVPRSSDYLASGFT